MCLQWEYTKKRWFFHKFGQDMATAYLNEEGETQPNYMQLYLLGRANGKAYLIGGDKDDTLALTTTLQTPSWDAGDERLQKLYVDAIHDIDGTGQISITLSFNNNSSSAPVTTGNLYGSRYQLIQNISSLLNLALYRNLSVTYSWTGGTNGPRVYAFEPSFYVQPYVSTSIVTQYINLGYAGWKHHRRLYAGLISNSPLTFTVKTQDGRVYNVTVPNTNGQFRIMVVMLPQGVKDLAFAYSLTGGTFALFPDAFTIETKEWMQPEFVELPIFKT
jgi:hypothetical protein